MAKNRTGADWAELIARWRRSGIGGPEFAASESIDVKQLRWWKWHLGKRPRIRTTSKAAPQMVRVEVRAPRVVDRAVSTIDVVRDGWIVRVARGFDLETLDQVLDVLGSRKAC